jgi:hypothetical protein
MLNFGDEITPDIVRTLWGRNCELSPIDDCEFVAAGSVLEQLQMQTTENHIKVWGSGYIKPGPVNKNKNLRFHAVRGPLSRERAGKPELSLGDPGLLANKVYKHADEITHKVGIVAHYVDLGDQKLDAIKENPDYKIINPLQSPQEVAFEITSCELVLSSSLHGLIFADSFGVPNAWMPLSDKLAGGEYKFRDYYQSTGRELKAIAAEDVLLDATALERLVQGYQAVPNLKSMQGALIGCFPYQIRLEVKALMIFALSPSRWLKLFDK